MGRIESSDLVAPKVLEPMRGEVDLSTKSLEVFAEAQNKVLQNSAKMAKQIKVNTAGFKALNAEEKKSKNALSEKEKADKRIIALQEKGSKVTKIQKERIAALRVEEQRRNKIITQQAKLQNQNIGAFEKLNLKIKQTSDRYRNLLVQEGKETRQTKLLRKEILQLNAVRDRANKSIGIGTNLTKGFRGGVSKLTGALGKMGLAFGAFAIIRNVFGVIKNFDQATADLSSVLGVNREEMAALTEQAKELGATTKFTASQVAELQIEYAKLGFTQSEIQGVTEATLQFAAAAGTELGNAATIVGSTLRGFGLDVSNTQRLVDVMAKSFSSSSLDIEKFSSAMSNVAPAASAIGLSVERTTALIGTLTDAGIDASSAGTGLRNMFLEAKKQGITFEEAMAQINASTDKLGTSFDLFGKKGATLGVILAENGVSVDALEDKLQNAGGAAKEMADKQLDTLGGALDLIQSAWEGFILGASEAGGVVDILKNIILFLARNLEALLTIGLNVIKFWIAYKIATKLAAVSNLLFGKSAIKVTNNFKGMSLAIVAVILIVKSLIARYNEARTAADLLERANEKINTSLDEEKVKLQLVGRELLSLEPKSEKRLALINKVNAEYGTTLQNLEDETEFVKQLAAAYKDIVQTLQRKISLQVFEEELVNSGKELLRLQRELENQSVFTSPVLTSARKQGIQLLQDYINELEGKMVKLQQEVGEGTATVIEEGTGGGTKKARKAIQNLFDALQEENARNRKIQEANLLKDGESQLDVTRTMRDLRLEDQEQELKVALELFGEFSDEYIDLNLKFQNELRKAEKETAEENKKNQQEANEQRFKDLTDQGNENLMVLENNALKEGKKKEEIDKIISDARIENLKRENEEALKLFGSNSPEYLKANLALNRALVEQDRKAAEEKKKIQEELVESLRHALATAAELIASSIERNIKALDRQIKEQERIFDESKDREQELKDIAKERGLDASESLNFEREAQKKALKTQQDLERKRQRAEALIAALRALAAQVESGQGNPVQNIKNQITSLKSFVDGAFYGGTETTVSDSLGYKPGRDSHRIAVDGSEAIFTGKQTSDLGIRSGGNSTDDIVRMYKSSFANESDRLNRIAVIQQGGDGNKELEGLTRQLIKEVKNQTDPNGLAFNAITGSLKYRDKRRGQSYTYPVSKKK